MKSIAVPEILYREVCQSCKGTGNNAHRVQYVRDNPNCSACKGTGVFRNRKCAACSGSGKNSIDVTCLSCQGNGKLSVPTKDWVFSQLVKADGSVRSSAPADKTDVDKCVKYVWRIARFHGGVDTHMPVMADLLASCFCKETVSMLDEWASCLAKEKFGTDLAAAFIWGKVMGYIK